MEEKKVLYSAIVLNDVSRMKLINSVNIPDGWKVDCHHMTLCLGSLTLEWKDKIGESYILDVSEYGFNPDNNAMAVKVDNLKRLIPGQAHVTVAINEEAGGKPRNSNDIVNWEKLPKPIVLSGTIQEITN